MSGPTVGSLFAGYGGLDLAVKDAIPGARTVWVAEYEPPSKATPKPTQAAARILAHRFPGVPNLGDITAVDWAAVEPVDIILGGFPCTDVSLAGARAGLTADTRSGLWLQMAQAVAILRPGLVVIENVRGLLSATADSDVEPCPWCLGEAGDGEPALRALGAVLADLAELGYDAAWVGLRAADVGAPHGRFRVFILAWPADPDSIGRRPDLDDVPAGDAEDDGRARPGLARAGRAGSADRGDVGPRAAQDAHGTAGGERGIAALGQEASGRAWADAGGSDRARAHAAGYADGEGLEGRRPGGRADERPARSAGVGSAADAQGDGRDEGRPESARLGRRPHAALGGAAAAADADSDAGRVESEPQPGRGRAAVARSSATPDPGRDGREGDAERDERAAPGARNITRGRRRWTCSGLGIVRTRRPTMGTSPRPSRARSDRAGQERRTATLAVVRRVDDGAAGRVGVRRPGADPQ